LGERKRGGKIRKTGIDILGDVPWGTHFCQFYLTKEDLIDILVPYFKAGLENNEFCMWITSEPLSEKEAKEAMREALPDFDRYLKREQIEILPHEEWYLKKGAFNTQRVLKGWVDKLDQALAQDYDGLRLTGNTFWLEKRDWRNFTEYEKEVNNVIGKYQMMAICSYSLDKCGASEVIDVVSNHQFALIRKEGKWKLIESSERIRAEEEIERILERLKERYAELNCLYGIDEISRKEGVTIEESLKEVAQLMPPAWQYPEITGSCITYEDKKYKTRKFKETKWMQRADIIVNNKKEGLVEVCYLEKKPQIDEGPFVKEERNLINAISERLGQIIERKKAEEELRKSRDYLEKLTNSMWDAVFSVKMPERVIEWSNDFFRLIGYNPEECFGKTTEFLYPDKSEFLNFGNKLKNAIAEGKDILHSEQSLKRKTGEVFPAEVTTTIFKEKGEVVRVTSIVRDATERKKAEEELRFHSEIMANMSEGICLTRASDDVFVYTNPKFEERFGYNPGEMLGKHVSRVNAPIEKYPKAVLREILESLDKKGIWKGEVHNVNKDGTTFWSSASVTGFKHPKYGKVWITVNEDITDRKRTEEELKSSQEQLRNLVARLQSVREEERRLIAREIHDELGQTLTVLKMDLFWLAKRIPKDQRPFHEKTKSMSKLIDKTIQRIKRISAQLRPGLLDYLGLPAAIEWEGEEFQNRTGIKCEVNIDSEDIIMEQDRSTAIFRIFQETLTNVARHANAKKIKVSLKEKAGKLELRVRDNGKGITEKQISDPKSFGLIGMRERAQFLGGEVKIRGVQDKGTTIIATVPLIQKEKA